MRALVYAPPDLRGRDRQILAMRLELEDLGHDYAGALDDPAACRAAVESKFAEVVACRPEHVPDLLSWVLPLEHHGPRPRTSALAVPLVQLVQLVEAPIIDLVCLV